MSEGRGYTFLIRRYGRLHPLGYLTEFDNLQYSPRSLAAMDGRYTFQANVCPSQFLPPFLPCRSSPAHSRSPHPPTIPPSPQLDFQLHTYVTPAPIVEFPRTHRLFPVLLHSISRTPNAFRRVAFRGDTELCRYKVPIFSVPACRRVHFSNKSRAAFSGFLVPSPDPMP